MVKFKNYMKQCGECQYFKNYSNYAGKLRFGLCVCKNENRDKYQLVATCLKFMSK